ncbi:hypothetical protein cypCar_00048903 [Cyprinus carpio]|nr:hypothetical protein cypCar_00048903 [Cyprinus carpio]
MAGVVWSLLTIISLFLCFTSTAAAEPKSAVGPVLDCDLDNDMYICTGAQYLITLSSCFCEYNICIPTTINPTTAVPNITLPDQCESQASEGCLQNVLDQIENITAQELPVTSNCVYLINELDCDKPFDYDLQRFREDLRVIIII